MSMDEHQRDPDTEITNLNMDDLNIEELEQRIELAAMDLGAVLHAMKPCNSFGTCGTFSDVCGTFGTCDTYT